MAVTPRCYQKISSCEVSAENWCLLGGKAAYAVLCIAVSVTEEKNNVITGLLHILTFINMAGLNITDSPIHGLSQDFETGCPNRGFIDFWVSKVWYEVHATNEMDLIYLQILLFRPVTALLVL